MLRLLLWAAMLMACAHAAVAQEATWGWSAWGGPPLPAAYWPHYAGNSFFGCGAASAAGGYAAPEPLASGYAGGVPQGADWHPGAPTYQWIEIPAPVAPPAAWVAQFPPHPDDPDRARVAVSAPRYGGGHLPTPASGAACVVQFENADGQWTTYRGALVSWNDDWIVLSDDGSHHWLRASRVQAVQVAGGPPHAPPGIDSVTSPHSHSAPQGAPRDPVPPMAARWPAITGGVPPCAGECVRQHPATVHRWWGATRAAAAPEACVTGGCGCRLQRQMTECVCPEHRGLVPPPVRAAAAPPPHCCPCGPHPCGCAAGAGAGMCRVGTCEHCGKCRAGECPASTSVRPGAHPFGGSPAIEVDAPARVREALRPDRPGTAPPASPADHGALPIPAPQPAGAAANWPAPASIPSAKTDWWHNVPFPEMVPALPPGAGQWSPHVPAASWSEPGAAIHWQAPLGRSGQGHDAHTLPLRVPEKAAPLPATDGPTEDLPTEDLPPLRADQVPHAPQALSPVGARRAVILRAGYQCGVLPEAEPTAFRPATVDKSPDDERAIPEGPALIPATGHGGLGAALDVAAP